LDGLLQYYADQTGLLSKEQYDKLTELSLKQLEQDYTFIQGVLQ
jgi:hypothetical protein